MGNITSLTRNGRQDGSTYGKVNQLTYSYDGNRLVSVSDAVASPTYNGFFGFSDGADQAVEYEYDANGNMTRDRNKGISSIQYNADNLPLRIQYDNGSRATYLYTADGTKLQVRYETSYAGLLSSGPPGGSASTAIAQTHTIDYAGNKIYEDGTLKKILVDGGYVEYNGGSPVYHAYLTDHQGNVRVVVDESATAKQVNHYYPYGGLMAESTGGDVQRYKYNGKELDRMHGLDWYDHGARHNDAAIGRWHSMDPLCEKYYDVSPYAYCEGSPVNNIDQNGQWSDPASALYYSSITPNSSIQYNPDTKDATLRWTVNIFSQDDDGSFVITNYRDFDDGLKVETINTVFHGIGSSLKDNSGNSSFGSNLKFYWHDAGERGFYGNQHVGAIKLSNIGTGITKFTGSIGNVLNIYQLGSGIYNDYQTYQKYGYTDYYNTAQATADVAGGWAGGFAGAIFGAKAGAAGGIWLGVGVIPASLIGSVIFGIVGSFGGSSLGAGTVDLIYEK